MRIIPFYRVFFTDKQKMFANKQSALVPGIKKLTNIKQARRIPNDEYTHKHDQHQTMKKCPQTGFFVLI